MGALIAWAAIILLAIGWIGFVQADEPAAPGQTPGIATADELQGRLVLGLHTLTVDMGQPMPDTLLLQLEALRMGSPIQRLAFVVMVDQLLGSQQALERLSDIDSTDPVWEDADRELIEVLRQRLLARTEGRSPEEMSVEQTERLGWYGDLLVGKVVPSSLLVGVIAAAGVWYVGFGLIGLAALLICGVLFLTGALAPRCEPRSGIGLILVETFAIWMLLFFGMQAIVIFSGSLFESEMLRITVAPACFILSLAALAWPRIRGVPWATTREAIGLSTRGFSDVLWGLLGYALSLPCMAIGVAIVFLLTWLVGEQPQPSHPAVERIASASTSELLLLFVLACVLAPIVEETMFRGVLYRHLRDLTSPAQRRGVGAIVSIASVAFSMFVSSAIFALIHPQGVLFAPALAGLACGFCLVREWRGSLLPGMIAHGVANFVTLLLNVGLQSGSA